MKGIKPMRGRSSRAGTIPIWPKNREAKAAAELPHCGYRWTTKRADHEHVCNVKKHGMKHRCACGGGTPVAHSTLPAVPST